MREGDERVGGEAGGGWGGGGGGGGWTDAGAVTGETSSSSIKLEPRYGFEIWHCLMHVGVTDPNVGVVTI